MGHIQTTQRTGRRDPILVTNSQIFDRLALDEKEDLENKEEFYLLTSNSTYVM